MACSITSALHRNLDLTRSLYVWHQPKDYPVESIVDLAVSQLHLAPYASLRDQYIYTSNNMINPSYKVDKIHPAWSYSD